MQVGYTAAEEGGGGATCRGPAGASRDQDPIYFNVTCTQDCPSFTNAPTAFVVLQRPKHAVLPT